MIAVAWSGRNQSRIKTCQHNAFCLCVHYILSLLSNEKNTQKVTRYNLKWDFSKGGYLFSRTPRARCLVLRSWKPLIINNHQLQILSILKTFFWHYVYSFRSKEFPGNVKYNPGKLTPWRLSYFPHYFMKIIKGLNVRKMSLIIVLLTYAF